MSGLSGQAFASWTSSSSCQTAVEDRVCFSRTADIKELQPPEPESRFTSFSMTFRRQHKHSREGLPGHWVQGLSLWEEFLSTFTHSTERCLYITKFFMPPVECLSLLLQKLQLSYLSRITFYFSSTDPLAFLNMAVCIYLYKI